MEGTSNSTADSVEPSECVPCVDNQDSSERIPPHGSSIGGAIFNFTNCIIGAGAIGLGGAINASGGLVSILCIIGFGVLTKKSLDMVVALSVETPGAHNSYEQLAKIAYGRLGWIAVVLSKSLYSFGCLVAYIIVVKDNFASALTHLIFGHEASSHSWLSNDTAATLFLSCLVILPLCLLRDMTSLSNLSAVSVFAMGLIVVIVIFLYFDNPDGSVRREGGSTYENWIEIRPGLVESLGTFVFTFVSQHTVHLAYESLHPDIRSVESWKKVSFASIFIATGVSLSVGIVVYMTFWDDTQSDLFEMYPPLRAVDLAKLLLCITMLLTFPLPFFTCRDMLILCLTVASNDVDGNIDVQVNSPVTEEQLQEPLLQAGTDEEEPASLPISEPPPRHVGRSSRFLIPGEERQLRLPYHVFVTFVMWGATTLLAIMAPSLGDVLDLVGCATGTVIAFILPALFSFRLKGYSHLAAFILVVGGVVGIIGTFYSVKKIKHDLSQS